MISLTPTRPAPAGVPLRVPSGLSLRASAGLTPRKARENKRRRKAPPRLRRIGRGKWPDLLHMVHSVRQLHPPPHQLLRHGGGLSGGPTAKHENRGGPAKHGEDNECAIVGKYLYQEKHLYQKKVGPMPEGMGRSSCFCTTHEIGRAHV